MPASFRPSILSRAALLAGLVGVSACSDSGSGDDDRPTTVPAGATPVLEDAALVRAGRRIPDGGSALTAAPASGGADAAAALAPELAILHEVIESHGGDIGLDCVGFGAQFGSCALAALHVKDAAGALEAPGVRLWFHAGRRLLAASGGGLSLHHVNGDLYYLESAADFDAGPVRSVRFVTEFSQLALSDFPPRAWLTDPGGRVRLLENTVDVERPFDYVMPIEGTNAKLYDGAPNEVADAANRQARYQPVAAATATLDPAVVATRTIPSAVDVVAGSGTLDVSGGFRVPATVLSAERVAAITDWQRRFVPVGDAVAVSTTLDATLPEGSHVLEITTDGISIRGTDETAVLHGAMSLLSLVAPGTSRLPIVRIADAPRYAYRGVQVDVARHFHGVDTIERLLDHMHALKLNVLQLHLADDEGWRLEIPSLPELTTVGGERRLVLDDNGRVVESVSLMPQLGSGPDADNAGSGYFTRNEFVALLRYADARGIAVIPAFDMPGHARAAVVSMRARAAALDRPRDTSIRLDDPDDDSRFVSVQFYDDGILNPCVDGTWNFIDTLVDEVKAMYDEAGVELSLWHMGGDEANNIYTGAAYAGGGSDPNDWDEPWARSPACERLIAEDPAVASRSDLTRWFVGRVATVVAANGIEGLMAYQDIYDGLVAVDLATPRAVAAFWDRLYAGGVDSAPALVTRGFETVIAPPDITYFDQQHEVHPEALGQYWASRATSFEKVFRFTPDNLAQNAEVSTTQDGRGWSATATGSRSDYLGVQAHLWTEKVRTGAAFDGQLFPRLYAFAERAWHRPDWELPEAGQTFSGDTALTDRDAQTADLAAFTALVVTRELPKADRRGTAYRVPVPGAVRGASGLEASADLPGLPLQYTTGDGRWNELPADPADDPAAAAATAVRALSADRERAGRAAPLVD